MALKVDEPPEEEPVTVAEAKLAAKIDADITEDDTLVAEWITAAREMFEKRLGQAFVETAFLLYLDRFPCNRGGLIELPRWPLVEVSQIRYVDADGDWQTLADDLYQVDAVSRPGRLMPAYGELWPSTRCQMNAVEISFSAGEADAAAVPKRIKQAIYLAVGYWNENRSEAELRRLDAATVLGIDRLLGSEDEGVRRLAGVDD